MTLALDTTRVLTLAAVWIGAGTVSCENNEVPDAVDGARPSEAAVVDARAPADAKALDGARLDAIVTDGTIPDSALADATVIDGPSGPIRDAFGIVMLHPTAAGGSSWDSRHWNDGNARSLSSSRELDPNDPTGWSMLRGSGLGSPPLAIDGNGTATLRGNQPRIYFVPGAGEGFVNIEATMYYRRVSDDGTAWGGGVFGARTAVDGHSNEPCTATTYYARLRHDGSHDFAKELKHPTASANDRQTVFAEGLPTSTWIGVKVVVRNVGTDRVRLEHYVDQTGGVDGGDFTLVGQYEDNGSWQAAQGGDCGRPDNFVVREGGGVVIIRNTMGSSGESQYRWVSIREIDPLP